MPMRHVNNWEGTPEMGMPQKVTRSIAAVAIGVAAFTAMTATNAHAVAADAELTAVVAEQDSSSAERTKEERTATDRTKEERLGAARTKEE